ncbi:MAG: hypothetical protein H6Q74_1483 [Firmicutes bacterium]|nr:hypothetical protein [Bacillota bacterium]
MKHRIQQLLKRLTLLGYCSFEINSILQEAIGPQEFDSGNDLHCANAIAVLEKYERLGAHFVNCYSK